jgi:hypothetical protein
VRIDKAAAREALPHLRFALFEKSLRYAAEQECNLGFLIPNRLLGGRDGLVARYVSVRCEPLDKRVLCEMRSLMSQKVCVLSPLA